MCAHPALKNSSYGRNTMSKIVNRDGQAVTKINCMEHCLYMYRFNALMC